MAAAGQNGFSTVGSKGPYCHYKYREKCDARGDAMRELDNRRYLFSMGNDRAVAQGPVIATAFAGPRGAHQRSPQDHQQIESENRPGELREAPHCFDYSGLANSMR